MVIATKQMHCISVSLKINFSIKLFLSICVFLDILRILLLCKNVYKYGFD